VGNRFSLFMPEKYSESEKLQLFLNELWAILDRYEQAASDAALSYFKDIGNTSTDNLFFLNEQARQKTAQLKAAEDIMGEINRAIRQHWPTPPEQLAPEAR
jgi:hypothetical protein